LPSLAEHTKLSEVVLEQASATNGDGNSLNNPTCFAVGNLGANDYLSMVLETEEQQLPVTFHWEKKK